MSNIVLCIRISPTEQKAQVGGPAEAPNAEENTVNINIHIGGRTPARYADDTNVENVTAATTNPGMKLLLKVEGLQAAQHMQQKSGHVIA